MSSYPCKYLSTRKCCCCFTCDPRQVFLILSSTCLLLGLINMCSYPLCPAVIISSLVLAFYYFGAGIFLLYAVTGFHERLLRSFPWLMLFSYIPIAAYIGCLVASLECIKTWTTHYTIGENPEYAQDMYIGIICLYSMFAIVDFLFSTYSLMLSMGQLDDKPGPSHMLPGMSQNPYGGPFAGMPVPQTQLAYATIVTSTPSSDLQLDSASASGPPTPTSLQSQQSLHSEHSHHSQHSHHSEHSQHSQQSQESHNSQQSQQSQHSHQSQHGQPAPDVAEEI